MERHAEMPIGSHQAAKSTSRGSKGAVGQDRGDIGLLDISLIPVPNTLQTSDNNKRIGAPRNSEQKNLALYIEVVDHH